MTIIKVTCPRCGDLDLQIWQLLARRTEATASYEFTCTVCEIDVVRDIDQPTLDRLSRAGVRVVTDLGPMTHEYVAAATRYLRENDLLVADAQTVES